MNKFEKEVLAEGMAFIRAERRKNRLRSEVRDLTRGIAKSKRHLLEAKLNRIEAKLDMILAKK